MTKKDFFSHFIVINLFVKLKLVILMPDFVKIKFLKILIENYQFTKL